MTDTVTIREASEARRRAYSRVERERQRMMRALDSGDSGDARRVRLTAAMDAWREAAGCYKAAVAAQWEVER